MRAIESTRPLLLTKPTGPGTYDSDPKTTTMKPATKQRAPSQNLADRYAILQRKVEDLEKVHNEGKKSVSTLLGSAMLGLKDVYSTNMKSTGLNSTSPVVRNPTLSKLIASTNRRNRRSSWNHEYRNSRRRPPQSKLKLRIYALNSECQNMSGHRWLENRVRLES